MKPSGNYDTRPLRHGTQADHIRSVTRMAVRMAEEMAALFPDFRYGRDILIAGCLCHDIGKVWEFDPENVKRWKADPRAAGRPSLRHPAYGVYICLTLGLPEGMAHCAAAHSGEGELVLRSLENTILHQADYTFWRVAEAGGQLAETDPWLDGELVRSKRHEDLTIVVGWRVHRSPIKAQRARWPRRRPCCRDDGQGVIRPIAKRDS